MAASADPRADTPALVARAHARASSSGVATDHWGLLLGALEPLAARSPEHYAHSLRVGIYAHDLAMLERLDAGLALQGGCGHDVGKSILPDAVLRAPCFGITEQRAMRAHPEAGRRLLERTHPQSALVAGLHHRFQEDSYGTALDDVALGRWGPAQAASIRDVSELVSVCDFYDALTTRDNDRGLLEGPGGTEAIAGALQRRFGASSARVTWLLDHDIARAR